MGFFRCCFGASLHQETRLCEGDSAKSVSKASMSFMQQKVATQVSSTAPSKMTLEDWQRQHSGNRAALGPLAAVAGATPGSAWLHPPGSWGVGAGGSGSRRASASSVRSPYNHLHPTAVPTDSVDDDDQDEGQGESGTDEDEEAEVVLPGASPSIGGSRSGRKRPKHGSRSRPSSGSSPSPSKEEEELPARRCLSRTAATGGGVAAGGAHRSRAQSASSSRGGGGDAAGNRADEREEEEDVPVPPGGADGGTMFRATRSFSRRQAEDPLAVALVIVRNGLPRGRSGGAARPPPYVVNYGSGGSASPYRLRADGLALVSTRQWQSFSTAGEAVRRQRELYRRQLWRSDADGGCGQTERRRATVDDGLLAVQGCGRSETLGCKTSSGLYRKDSEEALQAEEAELLERQGARPLPHPRRYVSFSRSESFLRRKQLRLAAARSAVAAADTEKSNDSNVEDSVNGDGGGRAGGRKHLIRSGPATLVPRDDDRLYGWAGGHEGDCKDCGDCDECDERRLAPSTGAPGPDSEGDPDDVYDTTEGDERAGRSTSRALPGKVEASHPTTLGRGSSWLSRAVGLRSPDVGDSSGGVSPAVPPRGRGLVVSLLAARRRGRFGGSDGNGDGDVDGCGGAGEEEEEDGRAGGPSRSAASASQRWQQSRCMRPQRSILKKASLSGEAPAAVSPPPPAHRSPMICSSRAHPSGTNPAFPVTPAGPFSEPTSHAAAYASSPLPGAAVAAAGAAVATAGAAVAAAGATVAGAESSLASAPPSAVVAVAAALAADCEAQDLRGFGGEGRPSPPRTPDLEGTVPRVDPVRDHHVVGLDAILEASESLRTKDDTAPPAAGFYGHGIVHRRVSIGSASNGSDVGNADRSSCNGSFVGTTEAAVAASSAAVISPGTDPGVTGQRPRRASKMVSFGPTLDLDAGCALTAV